ncbi:MAG TPA: DOMON-like domain-containing protein [Steroidobacteraceae bacterium]|nr:DOMON-like domain-containing protein [Steroidobacteraceae bacterium]
MARSDSSFVSLLPHPDTPSGMVRRVAACVEPIGPDLLRFRYVLEADPEIIRIPPPVTDAGRTDELWAHTCFEAFLGFAGSAPYLELNFSPSGQWAAYRFDSYRQGMASALDGAPRLALRRGRERLELQAEVHLGGSLPAVGHGPGPGGGSGASGEQRLRVALSTVVEDREGRLSYWALRHPSGRPDFHHPESFSLALELASHPLSSP